MAHSSGNVAAGHNAAKLGGRPSLRTAGAALLLGCASFAASAQTAGQVVVYHLNANVQDRGACVQMSPALPQTPWACVWKSTNPLYSELNTMLLAANGTSKVCTLWLDGKDSSGLWNLRIAECR